MEVAVIYAAAMLIPIALVFRSAHKNRFRFVTPAGDRIEEIEKINKLIEKSRNYPAY